MLQGFWVENYRAFSKRQEIELRPLTLFFGWNSSGKSALVRFLPLLAESIQQNDTPIFLAAQVCQGAAWPEFVSKLTGRSQLLFGLRWRDQAFDQLEWRIDGDPEGRWQQVQRFSINGQPVELGDADFNHAQPGLIPELDPSCFDKDALLLQMNELKSNVQWLSGIRAKPARNVAYSGGKSRTLASDGSNAIEHLIAAQLRSSEDPLLVYSKEFFATFGEQLSLENVTSGLWRALVRPSANKDLMVNICDTGEGYTQVLPVLVALARACTGGPKLICLEQPELHLHTRAQAELAKTFIQAVQHESEPQLVVETHSEVLLLSIQLAIANGEIASDKVRVYWLETNENGSSNAIPVDFDTNGRPKSTALTDAFKEAMDLSRSLLSKSFPKVRV